MKKEFEEIAKILRTYREDSSLFYGMVKEFIAYFESKNPKFDKEKFRRAVLE